MVEDDGEDMVAREGAGLCWTEVRIHNNNRTDCAARVSVEEVVLCAAPLSSVCLNTSFPCAECAGVEPK